MNFKIDKFVLAIIVVVIIAYIFPDLGRVNGPLPLDGITSIGVSLIFFFYGLKLSPKQIKEGLQNWKLHLLVQSSTFILFPIIVISIYPFIDETSTPLWIAFLFLAALPSTVSSSVVMVSIAKGNIPAAIFNASISGLIGIVLTPLWMGMFLNQSSNDYNLIEVYQKLLLEILIPIILGIGLQRFLGKYARMYSKALTLFDKSVILLIIYKSFSRSFLEKVFNNVGILELLLIFWLVILLFWLVYTIIGIIAKRLHFNTEDTITAQYCGTKKSLVHGTVFSKILFQNVSFLGIILLPLMMFHAFQILTISIIASKQSKRK